MNFSGISLHSPEIGVRHPKFYGDIQGHHNMSSTLHILSSGKYKHHHYGSSIEKDSHFFSLLGKNFCFSLVICENFQYLISSNEVSESVDGLQIRVNLANPKIKIQWL